MYNCNTNKFVCGMFYSAHLTCCAFRIMISAGY
jgi:hypothetical protein